MNKDELIRIFSKKIRSILERTPVDFLYLEEIRLRAGQPLVVIVSGSGAYLDEDGKPSGRWERAYRVTLSDIRETLEYVSRYSLYAFEEELRQGFITISGGHRVGLAGRAVVKNGAVQSLKQISSLNVRLAHQILGAADRLMPCLFREGRMGNTLIVSPPRLGKTTLLRDMIRQLSNGYGGYEPLNVGVVDERSELAACVDGVPQNDLGRHTDVLDACPKAEGILMLLRTMSPQVIAVDEVGRQEDFKALRLGLCCGCTLLATVHASSMEELRAKPVIRSLVEEKLFDQFVVLRQAKEGNVFWEINNADGQKQKEGLR